MADFICALEFAVNVEFMQRGNGVLGGAPWHAGVGLERGHCVYTLMDEVCHVQAAVKTRLGFADRVHGLGRLCLQRAGSTEGINDQRELA